MKDLLLCALHQLGDSSTAAEIHDKAVAIALDGGWSKAQLPKNVHQVSAIIRNLCQAKDLIQTGTKREDGTNRPAYGLPLASGGYVRGMECPPPPVDETKTHPIETLNRSQLIVLFDTFQVGMEINTRQRLEREALAAKHCEELERMLERIRSRLIAAGMG